MQKNIKYWWIGGTAVVLGVILMGGWLLLDRQKQVKQTAQERSIKNEDKPLQDGAIGKNNQRRYKISKQDRQSKQYVSSGNLTQPGQFSISPAGNRTELKALQNLAGQTVVDQQAQYTLQQVKWQMNTPKTDEALRMAQMAFNSRDVQGDYQNLIIKYQIKNIGNQPLQTDGVKAVVLNQDYEANTLSGLDNDARLANQEIQPGDTQDSFVTVLIPRSLTNQVQNVQVQFSKEAIAGFALNQGKGVNDAEK
ncbi:hypothetical protein ACJQWY_06650 [Weissella kandleri]|uniref:hypothetical protein n=1 Tax=Weissella kandleri TaxID=1616 RepID=UPI00387E76EF